MIFNDNFLKCACSKKKEFLFQSNVFKYNNFIFIVFCILIETRAVRTTVDYLHYNSCQTTSYHLT